MVDFGWPVINGHQITANTSGASTLGFLGFSILEADDLDGVKALLEGHPHLEWDDAAEIEIHEGMPIPGM